jgi:HlyD family secretion protein
MRRYLITSIVIVSCLSLGVLIGYAIKKEKKSSNEITLYGNVDVRLVDIGFRVQGRIEKLFFEEGDVVKKGELLCVLEKDPYDAQVKEASAKVAAVLADLKNAKILLDRRKDLIGVGGVSQEDLDNAWKNYNQLSAELKSAKSSLQIQKDNLAYTEVRAPADGIILSRVREPGTAVNPTDPVYTISVASPVWIRAFAEEPELGNIYYGMPAEIHTDTPGAPVYKGRVGFISPMAEFTPKTVETTQLRTDLVYRLRIYAENPDWRLKQGMPVTVKLLTGGPKKNDSPSS